MVNEIEFQSRYYIHTQTNICGYEVRLFSQAQSARAVEYTDCISTEGVRFPYQRVSCMRN